MYCLRLMALRLRGLLFRRRIERDMEEEMSFHVRMRSVLNAESGMPRDEARRQAFRRFGNVSVIKEYSRDIKGGGLLESALKDVSYATRMLRKSPEFTLSAVLALAIGIGANTAIFSVINGVLLKRLGYRDPERLVKLWEKWGGSEKGVVSYPNFRDWQEGSRSFEKMAAFREAAYNLTGEETPERVGARQVTADFLSLLGVEPVLGRDFRAEEDRPGAGLTALISHGLWVRRFGRDPSIVGKTIILDDNSYVVIGVLPSDFHFYRDVDLLAPMHAKSDSVLESRAWHPGIEVIARLKPGSGIAVARSEMASIAEQLAEQYPDTNREHGVTVGPLYDDIVGDGSALSPAHDIRPLFFTLAGAVAFVLLIACANVAGLMLSQASARRREIAIRSALGGGRLRLARLFMTESLLLALVGGGLGLLIAWWGTDLAMKSLPRALPRAAEITVDTRVLFFTLGVSILTGIIFGLAPAVQATRPDVNEILKEGGRGPGSGRRGAQQTLVAAEIALALVLLVGTGLLIRSFAALHRVNPGFDPENVLSLRVSLSPGSYSDGSKIRRFYKELLSGTGNLAGVQAAAATTVVPLDGYGIDLPFYIKGRPAVPSSELPLAMSYVTTPSYLEALRIPLLRGRFFDDRDVEQSPRVTVIDENMARQYFSEEDPIGKSITIQVGKELSVDLQIVGVVAHVRQENLYADADAGVAPTQFYTALGQLSDRSLSQIGRNMSLLLSSNADPLGYVPAVRSQVRAIDPNQMIYAVRPMKEVVSSSIADRRFVMMLLGLFSFLSLLLASIGIYGLMSYSVSGRRQEIGIRMALGAGRNQVLMMVVGDGARLVLIGVGAGAAGALALTRFMSAFLYGVSPTDLITFLATPVFLSGVALLASYLPARRAARGDPISALRHE